MPFLKLLNIKHEIEMPPEQPVPYYPTIGFADKSNKSKTLILDPMRNLTPQQKGNRYEAYIESLYRGKGYTVYPQGRLKGGWDGGYDLRCMYSKKKQRLYTVLVQCKYRDYSYSPNARIDITDVYKLFGAVKHYEMQHKREIVSGAFWTTLKNNQCRAAHEVAQDLGITFYEGVFVYIKAN